MNDIRNEEKLTMDEAAVIERVNVKTVQRWVKVTDDAGRLKRKFLESYMCGGRRYTSREALFRFKEVSQPANLPPAALGTAHADAMAYLASQGIGTRT